MSRSVLARLLRRQIADPGAVWSMGTFGAFATYRHDAGDAADTGPLRLSLIHISEPTRPY